MATNLKLSGYSYKYVVLIWRLFWSYYCVPTRLYFFSIQTYQLWTLIVIIVRMFISPILPAPLSVLYWEFYICLLLLFALLYLWYCLLVLHTMFLIFEGSHISRVPIRSEFRSRVPTLLTTNPCGVHGLSGISQSSDRYQKFNRL